MSLHRLQKYKTCIMDSNDNLAIVISIAAILLGLFQFFLSEYNTRKRWKADVKISAYSTLTTQVNDIMGSFSIILIELSSPNKKELSEDDRKWLSEKAITLTPNILKLSQDTEMFSSILSIKIDDSYIGNFNKTIFNVLKSPESIKSTEDLSTIFAECVKYTNEFTSELTRKFFSSNF